MNNQVYDTGSGEPFVRLVIALSAFLLFTASDYLDKRYQHIAKNYSWIQMTKDGIGNYILVESGLLIP
jgi:hypothetical protein